MLKQFYFKQFRLAKVHSLKDKNSSISKYSVWHQYRFLYRTICRMRRVFADGSGDRGSIPGRVIPKTQKIVLDAALFNTQHYKVKIKGKVEQSREWSCAHWIEKDAFGSPLTKVANFTYFYMFLFTYSLNIKNNLFLTIQFSITTHSNSIWSIYSVI